jgi:hypothetical protein
MKAAGYSEADVDEASSLYLLTIRCRRMDSGWNELKAERKADQNKPWYDACPYLDRELVNNGMKKPIQMSKPKPETRPRNTN